ncbi:uncharacterized protein LOC141854251 [Brevipalpus obovatus]|uniref:uncharacterized protein LOC141854251 n=1 Tax=Brevipalpus obovatus TaxID=246614 RepID=UPI003D9F889B
MRCLLLVILVSIWAGNVLCETDQKLVSSSTNETTRSTKRSETGEKPKINVLELISGVGKALHILLSQNQTQNLGPKETSGVLSNSTLEERNGAQKEDIRRRAEELRVEIAKRASQLQRIVGSAVEILKDRGDVVFRRILEHINSRLEQAKNSADKILKEPATSEMAIRTLNSINNTLSSITSNTQNLLNRVNIRINVDLKKDKPQETVEVIKTN